MTQTPTATELKQILAELRPLMHQAGALALRYFQTAGPEQLQVEWKPDDSPVTRADREIEQFLRTQLRQRYPDFGILGEEFGSDSDPELSEGMHWILDPIDGTRSFARGIPIFGIQVALVFQREPILGWIHLPALREEIYAARGLGCHWNGAPCRVSCEGRPERSLIHVHERTLVDAASPRLRQWLHGVQLERNWGDCYSFILVATGRAEAALDPRMQVWDSAPLPILLQEAGGVFMDWSGTTSIWSGSAVAVNAELAPLIGDLLKPEPVL